MVVDDDQDTVEVLSVLVSILGYEPCGATTGRQAIAMASELRPHVILLDIGLPDITGYEVVRAIHEAGLYPFIVAATGYAHDRDRERAMAAGFDQHIPKPVTAERIRQVMQTAERYSDMDRTTRRV